MHSNFLTPPDYVKSVLIINATEEQLQDVANAVQGGDVQYNIYLHDDRMEDTHDWLRKIIDIADAILIKEESELPNTYYTKFGPSQEFKNPVDYFTK
jgi:hypothetical protein